MFSGPFLPYIAPALQIRGLTSFRFALHPIFVSRIKQLVTASVSGTDVVALARAWPRLERLHLECALTRGCAPLSAMALARAAAACPRLARVMFPSVRAPSMFELAEMARAGEPPPAHALVAFELVDAGYRSAIEDPAVLARFFHRLFPNLVLHSEGGAGKWKRTAEVLELMKSASPLCVQPEDD